MEKKGALPQEVKTSFDKLVAEYQKSSPEFRDKTLENGLKEFKKDIKETKEFGKGTAYMKTLATCVKCTLSVVKETMIGTPKSLESALHKYNDAVTKVKLSHELNSLKESASRNIHEIQSAKFREVFQPKKESSRGR
jgi:hypothetical protein